MPVHKATGPRGGKGWQFGQSGKVYPTKGQAMAQARAMFANGYKGSSSNTKSTSKKK